MPTDQKLHETLPLQRFFSNAHNPHVVRRKWSASPRGVQHRSCFSCAVFVFWTVSRYRKLNSFYGKTWTDLVRLRILVQIFVTENPSKAKLSLPGWNDRITQETGVWKGLNANRTNDNDRLECHCSWQGRHQRRSSRYAGQECENGKIGASIEYIWAVWVMGWWDTTCECWTVGRWLPYIPVWSVK